MSSKNYVVDSGFFPAQKAGFLYETGAGQRFLKSKKSGFAATDTAATAIEAATVDWTDGKNTVTWIGNHRYEGEFWGKFVCRDKKAYSTENAGINGVVIGAAYKNGFFIVFAASGITKKISCYFVDYANGIVFDALDLVEFGELQQAVLISPDCTKAATIIIPVGENGVDSNFLPKTEHTHIVEFSINLASKTATVSSVEVQVVKDYIDVEAPRPINSPISAVTCAVDYDSTNTQNRFVTTSSYVLDGHNYSNLELFVDFSGSIDYNGIKQVSLSEYIDIEQGTCVTDFTYLVFTDVDLRYGLYCYTEFHVTTTNHIVETTDSFGHPKFTPWIIYTETRDFKLKIGTFEVNIKPQESTVLDMTGDKFIAGFGVLNDSDTRLHQVLFYKVGLNPTLPNGFGVRRAILPLYNLFTFECRFQDDAYRPQSYYTRVIVSAKTENFVKYRTALNLTDRYKNKLLQYRPLRHVFSDTVNFLITQDASVIVKVDNKNNVLSNDIVELKGVV